MNPKFIKRGIAVVALASAILAPTAQAFALETVAILGVPKRTKKVELDQNALIDAAKEMSVNTELSKELKMESSEEAKLNQMLSGKVFVMVDEIGYLAVNSEANENSSYVGKVYENSVVKVVKRTDTWTEISTGTVVGHIKTENIISGKDALAKAKAILTAQYPETDITTLDKETIENSFSVGETLKEEQVRIEAAKRAEAERLAAEAAAIEAANRAKGQAVVDYGKQFIGNPYVYGGTSLTRGTDCSGFVRGVYAKFGVSLPRTSYSMRSVGRAVSYSEIQPGDIVCYPGHVGIYAGNGQIVNAIGDGEGIGMSNARYTRIITIRRIF